MTANLPEKGASNAIYLIDVSSFIFRAYYSIGPLSKRDGTPTNAVFGVANMLVSLVADRAPAYIAAAMDSRTPTFRKELCPSYKANRPPPPEDLKLQFPLTAGLIEGFQIAVVQKDGFEADDIIATLTHAAEEKGLEVVIVSGDKDLMQLIKPGTVMFDTMKNKIWDDAAVEEKWGVPPRLLGDLLAVAGDSSDNIPGIPKIGPKTAAPLLMEHGGLDNLIANRSSLKSKATAERIANHIDDAMLSKKLVTLCTEVPVEIDWDKLRYAEPDPAILAASLDALEFTKLRERLVGNDVPLSATPLSTSKEAACVYRTVSTEDELTTIAATIRETKRFAVDLETTSTDAVIATIVGMALSWKPSSAVYIPIAHKHGNTLSLNTVLGIVGPMLEDPDVEVVVQNIKYEDTIFRRHGLRIQNVAFDPMLASYLIRAENRQHNLDILARDFLGRETISYDEVTEKKRGEQLSFDAVSVINATDYAGEDADIALSLAEVMAPLVKEAEAESLLHDIEIPLARVLCGMELEGISIDTGLLHAMSHDFGKKIAVLEKDAFVIAGRQFNLNSPKQLSELFFDELKLPVQKKTKTGFSVDSDVLEALAPLHPLPAVLLEHRTYTKLKNTYLDALPRLVNPSTLRIHTSFNQAVAATGRLSSSNPNLQNIPIRSDAGREIRRAFVASEGHVLLSCDYSQIELRILAHLSEDPELVDAFTHNDDIHVRTARAIFGYGPGDVVSAGDRAKAKTVNFGVIYGKTAFSLAKELAIPRGEAQRFIDEYFHLYQGVSAFMDRVVDDAKKTKTVSTLLGRKRLLPDISSRNPAVRGHAERMARNTPIQGTAADLIKVAMIHVDEMLCEEKLQTKMLLTVHDELVFEVPIAEIDRAKALIKHTMEHAMSLAVPLVADAGVGANWGEAH
jgi:DNA polymerase-1